MAYMKILCTPPIVSHRLSDTKNLASEVWNTYLAASVIGYPKIAVGIYGHAVRDTRYVVRLEIVKRSAISCDSNPSCVSFKNIFNFT